MLYRPYLAKSDNRRILPKAHPFAGAPEDWFSDPALSSAGLYGVSFDFFVNWSTGAVSPALWIKRIVGPGVPYPSADAGMWQLQLDQCDGPAHLRRLAALAGRCGASLTAWLFREQLHWTADAPLVRAALDGAGRVSSAGIRTVAALQQEIRLLSGGPVRIGRKGLLYSTSTLESYLSTTDALWPGDADRVLVTRAGEPAVLLEFKKHTLDTPMAGQQLSNYYPAPDGRKYDRLALLRDYLAPGLPFVVVYYPTSPVHHTVVLELVEGPAGRLRGVRRLELPLPAGPADGAGLLAGLLALLQQR